MRIKNQTRLLPFLSGVLMMSMFGILAFYNTSKAIDNFLYGFEQDLSTTYWYLRPIFTTNSRYHIQSTSTPLYTKTENNLDLRQNLDLDCTLEPIIGTFNFYVSGASTSTLPIETYVNLYNVPEPFPKHGGGDWDYSYTGTYAEMAEGTLLAHATTTITTLGWQTATFNYTCSSTAPVNVIQITNNSLSTQPNLELRLVGNSIINGSHDTLHYQGYSVTDSYPVIHWDTSYNTTDLPLGEPWYFGQGFDLDYYLTGTNTNFTLEYPKEAATYDNFIQISGTCSTGNIGFKNHNQDSNTDTYFQSTCSNNKFLEFKDLTDGLYLLTASTTDATITRNYAIRTGTLGGGIFDLPTSSPDFDVLGVTGKILQFLNFPPFSYVKQIAEATAAILVQQQSNAYTLPTASLTIPTSSQYYNGSITLFDSNTMTRILTTEQWSPIRTAFKIVLYLGFGFYIFYRVKYFV